jgi:hypothetical protein
MVGCSVRKRLTNRQGKEPALVDAEAGFCFAFHGAARIPLYTKDKDKYNGPVVSVPDKGSTVLF